MTIEKFQSEVQVLERFFTTFCEDNHDGHTRHQYDLQYREGALRCEPALCDECHKLLAYSFDRLLACPHENKPRCRTCPHPCYEKREWKQLAKLMRYSGLQLGVIKIKGFCKRVFEVCEEQF